MECVHHREQPERLQHIPYKQYSEISEQVIFKLYLARVQIVTTTH
jgi:hypothetical protein